MTNIILYASNFANKVVFDQLNIIANQLLSLAAIGANSWFFICHVLFSQVFRVVTKYSDRSEGLLLVRKRSFRYFLQMTNQVMLNCFVLQVYYLISHGSIIV